MSLDKAIAVSALSALAIFASACAKETPREEAIDYNKSFKESLVPFVPSAREMEALSVSSDAQSSMLDCSAPSTALRLKGDSITRSYKVISRDRANVDGHFKIVDEDKGYSTDNKGSIYKKSYALSRFSFDDLSALSQGPLGYTDSCTTSGCDTKRRQYSAGSASYLVEVNANVQRMAQKISERAKKQCSFQGNGSAAKRTVTQGTYNLNGTAYKAVKFTNIETGDLYCEGRVLGGSDLIFMGEANRTRVSIVLADSLPQVEEVAVSEPLACARTGVVQSDYVESGGLIYTGSSRELITLDLRANILSVDQYKKDQQERQDLILRLRNVATLARAEKVNADYEVSSAESLLMQVKADADEAQRQSTQADAVAAATGATDADKTTAVLKKSAATAAAQKMADQEKVVSSKRQLATIANQRSMEADAAVVRAESAH